MRDKLKYFFAGVFFSLGILGFSQNEASKWFFGANAGLDFMTSPPTILTNGMANSIEGTASISDGAGNLLFYTDGITIWNKLHATLANGFGLMGNSSTTQSALIVKQPGNATIYFVFTLAQLGQGSGLRYSVVDMSLAAGMGSVTTKNAYVYGPSTEKLCGVKHCNGTDVWVVSHDYQSNRFRANLVTATGVSNTPVLSSIGSSIVNSISTVGAMKISPNGKKLGLSIYYPPTFELYDFNTATGVVSNLIQMPVLPTAARRSYGCEFSPDGTKFYGLNEVYDVTTNPSIIKFSSFQICQWDVCAGASAAVIASQHSITTSYGEAMQLAPDGKIYVSRTDGMPGTLFMLGVINDPNANFPAINYNNMGQSVYPKMCSIGFPNFVTGFYKTPLGQFTYTVDPSVSCVTASLTPPPLISNTCSASSYTVDHVAWLFGDPASVTANTSTLITPTHTYPGNGIYKAKLILYNVCGGVIDTLKQEVLIGQVPLANSSSGFSLCAGQSLILNASGLTTYSWNTGATTSTISITPTANTSYTVEGLGLNGCPLKSVQVVTVNPFPVITTSGVQSGCVGTAFTQTASGADSYTWSSGAAGPVLNITPTAGANLSYTVTGDSHGCRSTAIATGTIFNQPQITLSGPQSACLGSGVVQTASGANSYTWSTGVTTNTALLTPVGTLSFAVLGTGNNGCIGIESVTITCYYLPQIIITGNDTVCSGSELTLTAAGATTYSWNTGNNTSAITVTPGASTAYTVSATDAGTGCSNIKSVMVNISPRPPVTLKSTTVCSGVSTTLAVTSATVPGISYSWNPFALGGPSITVSENATLIYTVIASAHGCVETATASLFIDRPPELEISPPVNLAPGASTTLHVSGATSYVWSPVDYLSCTDCDSPVASPLEDIEYCVSSSLGTCVSSVCVNVTMTCDTDKDFSMPNAFTPNGDQSNDAFCLKGWNECTSDFRIQIYDRWGERIFESGDSSFCWDGTYKGELLNSGVFVYVIHAKKIKGDAVDRRGNITLIR